MVILAVSFDCPPMKTAFNTSAQRAFVTTPPLACPPPAADDEKVPLRPLKVHHEERFRPSKRIDPAGSNDTNDGPSPVKMTSTSNDMLRMLGSPRSKDRGGRFLHGLHDERSSRIFLMWWGRRVSRPL